MTEHNRGKCRETPSHNMRSIGLCNKYVKVKAL